MAEGPRWIDDFKRALLQRGIPRLDVALAILAGVDVLLLAIRRDVIVYQAKVETFVLWFDRAVVVVFALEYLWSLLRSRDKRGYVKATWYDFIGLIPLPIALFRAFLLLRIAHAFLFGARDPGRQAEVGGGAGYFVTVFKRYEPVLLEELTDPLLVKLLKILRDALSKARYMQTIGESLDARRERINGVILKALRENAAMRLALSTRAGESAVTGLADELTDVVVAALTDPELDQVLRESIDEALAGLQARFAEKDYVPPESQGLEQGRDSARSS